MVTAEIIWVCKMISRKGQKAINEGVVGKYVKKDTPPDLPSKSVILIQNFILLFLATFLITYENCNLFCFSYQCLDYWKQ